MDAEQLFAMIGKRDVEIDLLKAELARTRDRLKELEEEHAPLIEVPAKAPPKK